MNAAEPAQAPAPDKELTREEAIKILNERQRKVRSESDLHDEPDPQRKILLRYPRLVAHLICHSLGYFCPRSAANAIRYYEDGKPFYCEWYCHMARGGGDLIEVGRNALLNAYKCRHSHKGYMAEYCQGRAVVLRSLAGNDPQFASWF